MSAGAPFGTDLTPECEFKLVAGKWVRVPVGDKVKEDDSSALRSDLAILRKDAAYERNLRRQLTRKTDHSNRVRSQTFPMLPPISNSMSTHRRQHVSVTSGASTGKGSNVIEDEAILRNISKKLNRIPRCRSKVQDVYRSLQKLDHLHVGSLSADDFFRALSNFVFSLDDDECTILVNSANASGGGSRVKYGRLCDYLDGLLSKEDFSRNGPAALHKPSSTPGHLHDIPLSHSRNVACEKHRMHHSSPRRLTVPKLAMYQHKAQEIKGPLQSVGNQFAFQERDLARLLVKVEHTLQDAGWGLDMDIRQLERALAVKDHGRTGYLSMEELLDVCSSVDVPLSQDLLVSLAHHCTTNQPARLIRWIAFIDLLEKAKPVLYDDVHPNVQQSKQVLGSISEGYNAILEEDEEEVENDRLGTSESGLSLGSSELPHISNLLKVASDKRGHIPVNVAVDIVKDYSKSHNLEVDFEQLTSFCLKRIIHYRGKALVHVQDIIDYLE